MTCTCRSRSLHCSQASIGLPGFPGSLHPLLPSSAAARAKLLLARHVSNVRRTSRPPPWDCAPGCSELQPQGRGQPATGTGGWGEGGERTAISQNTPREPGSGQLSTGLGMPRAHITPESQPSVRGPPSHYTVSPPARGGWVRGQLNPLHPDPWACASQGLCLWVHRLPHLS